MALKGKSVPLPHNRVTQAVTTFSANSRRWQCRRGVLAELGDRTQTLLVSYSFGPLSFSVLFKQFKDEQSGSVTYSPQSRNAPLPCEGRARTLHRSCFPGLRGPGVTVTPMRVSSARTTQPGQKGHASELSHHSLLTLSVTFWACSL